jgi:ATP-dependent protease ClpP protease subunit
MAIPLKPGQTVYVSFSAEINPQTTEALLGVCSDLVNAKVGTLYLLLSTPGGSVMHGLNLYNVLRALPLKLITHNVGNVDSIGNVVFLAGAERYSAPHATFMFHGVGFDTPQGARFEEKLLRERLDSVKADQHRIGAVIAAHSNLKTEDVENLFLEAKTRDPSYALTSGIVHAVRDAQIPPGATMLQLVFKR